MNVLVGCEFSGVVRDAFRAQGHAAMSCDLLPTEAPGPHYQGDVRDVLEPDYWDLAIFHPPCTYLANSGVRWLYTDNDRWERMRQGAEFFVQLLRAPIPRVCVENPIMHKHAAWIVGRRQDQVIQPWMFGHMETKGTCLWLRGLPHLTPTNDVREAMMLLPPEVRGRVHMTPDRKSRSHDRSRTLTGIGEAMASQWGSNLLSEKGET